MTVMLYCREMAAPELILTGKDFKLTESLKTYVAAHVARMQRYHRNITRVRMELDVERHHQKGDNFRVTGWVIVHGKTLQASEHAADMHAAVDGVVRKLARQLERDKERHVDRQKTGAAKP